MVLRLCEHLDLPLRERNTLLLSAGFAPLFKERALTDPALAPAREALALILKGHEPFPALVIDHHWTMISANAAVPALLTGVSSKLLEPPVNVLRLSLHPSGLASRIVNLGQWRAHLLERLRRQSRLIPDPVIADLLLELEAYPHAGSISEAGLNDVAVPFILRAGEETLSFLSTTTLFGAPTEVTLSELALEAFYPADASTAEAMRRRVT